MSRSHSSQKRKSFGLSVSHVLYSVRSVVNPPKNVPPPGIRAWKLSSYPLYTCLLVDEFVSRMFDSPHFAGSICLDYRARIGLRVS